MMVRYATAEDLGMLSGLDRHISRAELGNSIRLRRVLILHRDGALSAGCAITFFGITRLF